MYNAFVVALVVSIEVVGHEMSGMSMLSRPIAAIPLAGTLMGDLQTGLIVGASLGAIFMGVVNIGVSSTAEPSLTTGLTTAFTIKMGGNVDVITPIVFLLVVLGLQLMNMIFSFVCGPMAAKSFKFAKSGDQKEVINLHFLMWFAHYALYALIPFFAVLFEADVVKGVLDSTPKVIMNGLTIVGSLLPVVGMAMLLQMLWSKNTAVWFFLGAVVTAYLELPLIVIAAVGMIIVIVIAQRDLQLKNTSVHAVQSDATVNATLDQEEEDFFQ